MAVKTRWSGGSLCFGKSINHGLPEARRVRQGRDRAVPPPWVSFSCISSCLRWETGYWEMGYREAGYQEMGYWPMWPFGVTQVRSQLCWVCLGHVSSYSSLIKKKTPTKQPNTTKNRRGGRNNPSPPHTVSRQPGSCFIFFRVDFVLQVAGSHEPQK